MSRTSSRHRGKRKRERRVPWRLLVVGGLLLSLLAAPVAAYQYYSRDLPDIGDINEVASAQTSRILAKDGSVLADLYSENRVIIPLDQMPKHAQQAVVAIEDERYFEHRGVDIWGIARALVRDVQERRVAQGGSTITQQYVKNAYFSSERSLTRKIKEAILAFQLETKYSKPDILSKYLNTIYFGNGAYGLQAAAESFFGKPAKELTLPEAALLAGTVKNPTRFSAHRNPKTALERRNLVLDRMFAQKFITEEERDVATETAIKLAPERKTAANGIRSSPHFVEYIKSILLKEYGEKELFRGGLRVHTTLDPKLQKMAEESAGKLLDKPGDPSVAMVAVDPKSGDILAMVGGKDFEAQKFNLAAQGRRQPGSSFKVFVLAAYLAHGFSPDRRYNGASPATIEVPGKDWKVYNYSRSGGGLTTVRSATARSTNTVFAQMIVDVGPERVVAMAKQMGITSEIEPMPAIALGGLTVGVSPLEMAVAYVPLTNGGWGYQPRSITKVENAEGLPLEEIEIKRKRVLHPVVAHYTNNLLEGVVRGGTGTRARIGRPQAGKTGTTQEYGDAWFVGYTPDLVASVWVGYPAARTPMRNVHGVRVSGGSFPARIWADFARKALEDTEKSKFPKRPKGTTTAHVCNDPEMQDFKPNAFCKLDSGKQVFLKGKGPKKTCPIHKGISLPNLVGISLTEAQAKLEELELVVVVTEELNDEVALGTVLAQEPTSGTTVGIKTEIQLIVSGAGQPVSVPSLIGLSEGEAQAKLDELGLKIDRRTIESSLAAGRVLAHDPAPGLQRPRGSTVKLVVSSGTGGGESASVPSVKGMREDEARSKLSGAGFMVSVKADDQSGDAYGSGQVTKQDPAAGKNLDLGSTVTLWVNP